MSLASATWTMKHKKGYPDIRISEYTYIRILGSEYTYIMCPDIRIYLYLYLDILICGYPGTRVSGCLDIRIPG
jgi:hypothetical protein